VVWQGDSLKVLSPAKKVLKSAICTRTRAHYAGILVARKPEIDAKARPKWPQTTVFVH
jgi:hypothetical protein